jgi:hypothetical protein
VLLKQTSESDPVGLVGLHVDLDAVPRAEPPADHDPSADRRIRAVLSAPKDRPEQWIHGRRRS